MKIRVGVGLASAATGSLTTEAFWTIVDACEALGWDSIWFSERVASDAPDPLVAMAAVAGRTSRLKFGPSVMVVPGRNPALLAKQLATLDVVSGGRLVAAFGLGVEGGSDRAIFSVEKADAPGITDEAVALIRRLWSGERVTFEGRYFRLDGVAVGPRPVQKPHPDVWFGGVSPAALRRVGKHGDGWLPSFVTVGEYAEKADAVRRLAAEHGRAVDEEHFGALVPYMPEGLGLEEQVLTVVSARRPGVEPRDMVVVDGLDALRARLEAFVDAGAGKFVVTPVLPPRDWTEELRRVRAEVAEKLEN